MNLAQVAALIFLAIPSKRGNRVAPIPGAVFRLEAGTPRQDLLGGREALTDVGKNETDQGVEHYFVFEPEMSARTNLPVSLRRLNGYARRRSISGHDLPAYLVEPAR